MSVNTWLRSWESREAWHKHGGGDISKKGFPSGRNGLTCQYPVKKSPLKVNIVPHFWASKFPVAAHNCETQSYFYAEIIKNSMYWNGSAHHLSVLSSISVLTIHIFQNSTTESYWQTVSIPSHSHWRDGSNLLLLSINLWDEVGLEEEMRTEWKPCYGIDEWMNVHKPEELFWKD